jgi:hypothetical protein
VSTPNQGYGSASEWAVGSLLTRGKQAGVAIAPAANNDVDILCQGDSTLTVEVDMTGAATTDLTVQVLPFEADAATIMGVAIAPVTATGPSLSGGHVYYIAQFDVTAYDKVRIRITNNNVGAQTITRSSWRLA